VNDKMRAFVDPDKCQGHTLCAMKAPRIFTLRDEDGHSTAAPGEIPADAEAMVLDAVQSCPEQAVSVSGDDSSR
jgi:ferredoxin